MTDLFLIAHKVRGEPAFDIACKLEIAGEEAWIIPTSGHRAYPYWSVQLNELEIHYEGGLINAVKDALACKVGFDLARDHYSVSREPSAGGTLRQKVTALSLDDLDL